MLYFFCGIILNFWGSMANGSKNKYGLTPQQETFCLEYFKNGIASKAYKKAFPKSEKWTDSALYSRASNYLKNDKIMARLEVLNNEAKKSVQKNVVLNKTKILEEIIELQQNCKQAGQGQAGVSLQALKLLSQIAGMLSENTTNININNNISTAEVSNYLDL